MADRSVSRGLLAGLLAATCWSVADMLLVGFVPQPNVAFVQGLDGRADATLALLMLEGSPQRLAWGIGLATFSVVLYLLAVPALRRLLGGGRVATFSALALFAGYAWSPVGHAGFGYLGLLAKGMQGLDGAALDSMVVVFNQYHRLLELHWVGSVAASALGWLLFTVQVLRGRSALPRWMAACSPLLLAPLLGALAAPFPRSAIAVLVGCASLNLAQWVFFAAAGYSIRKRDPCRAEPALGCI
ncbi:DUF6796 family protein [Isoptericola jiangsuensis]|uniref:DUF6796 family protein n=1 Tax=Isoptericola jiangsuensis TaxID=548579 RepID=UPI00386DC93B